MIEPSLYLLFYTVCGFLATRFYRWMAEYRGDVVKPGEQIFIAVLGWVSLVVCTLMFILIMETNSK